MNFVITEMSTTRGVDNGEMRLISVTIERIKIERTPEQYIPQHELSQKDEHRYQNTNTKLCKGLRIK